MFYAENVKMTVKVDAKKLNDAVFTGSKLHDDYTKFRKEGQKIREKLDAVYKKFRKQDLTAKEREEIKKEAEEVRAVVDKEHEAHKNKFIDQNPTSEYSGILVSHSTYGKSGKEIVKMIKALNPEVQKQRRVAELLKKAEELNKVEVGLDEFMKDVKNVEYKVDDKFAGEKHNGIKYLATLNGSDICAVKKDGTVSIINSKGKETKSFKTELKGNPTSIATDSDNKIYVLATLTETTTKKIRGKEKKINKQVGVECLIYSSTGKKLNRVELKGIVTATGARVSGDKLIISDYRSRKIAIFDKKTGKSTADIKNMRPCCGILDFSINEKDEILVANLGAFRVQAYDLSGKNLLSFGNRGRGINEFHGCCNPVSVAYLKGGAIVTVEKDPTRIKIYSGDGAKEIQGIQELVKGCSYIPMTVDKDDNLYLASARKGIVKCSSVKL
jgi:hypothetical protein